MSPRGSVARDGGPAAPSPRSGGGRGDGAAPRIVASGAPIPCGGERKSPTNGMTVRAVVEVLRPVRSQSGAGHRGIGPAVRTQHLLAPLVTQQGLDIYKAMPLVGANTGQCAVIKEVPDGHATHVQVPGRRSDTHSSWLAVDSHAVRPKGVSESTSANQVRRVSWLTGHIPPRRSFSSDTVARQL
jgi:hypothetical protein